LGAQIEASIAMQHNNLNIGFSLPGPINHISPT